MFITDPGFQIRIFSFPDQGVKKAPDPGSGSATLHQPICNPGLFTLFSLVQEVLVPERGRDRVFTDFDLEYFWQWTDFTSYVECVMTIAALGET